MSKKVRKLERMLDLLDEFESLGYEEQVDFIMELLEIKGFFNSPEAMKHFFRKAYMTQSELMQKLIEHQRDKWTKELRQALKQARKETKVERK